jgi:hypothetical protein
MPRREPRSRHRNGAVPEVELDGSVTLYGLEDWTQIRDDSLLRVVPRAASDDKREAGDDSSNPSS